MMISIGKASKTTAIFLVIFGTCYYIFSFRNLNTASNPKELYPDYRESSLRVLKAEQIAQSLRLNYFRKSHLETPKFVSYVCDAAYCGGFGDRLKGVVLLFYLAVATDRYFVIDWMRPNALEQYFSVNSDWYDMSANQFSHQLHHRRTNNSSYRNKWRIVDDGTKTLVEKYNGSDFLKTDLEPFIWYEGTTNGFKALESIFSNELFASKLDRLVNDNHPKDFSLLISGALRALLGSPVPRLLNLYRGILRNTTGLNEKSWEAALKIGIQVRTLRSKWSEQGARVQHVDCFSEKVLELLATSSSTAQIVIFITGDSTEIVMELKRDLEKVLSNYRSLLLFETDSILPTNHLDRSPVSENAWFDFAKVFIDWLLLRDMNMLLISRSSFGETASLYSQAPTWQYAHWKAGDRRDQRRCLELFVKYSGAKRTLEF